MTMQTKQWRLRQATPADVAEMKEVFRQTVKGIDDKDYCKEEKADWAACADKQGLWERLVETLHAIVATTEEGKLAGFAAIADNGHLELMYVDTAWQRHKAGTAMLYELEDYARARGIKEITTEVSITARPFFEYHGYIAIKKQKRKAVDLCLTNFLMIKRLLPGVHGQEKV